MSANFGSSSGGENSQDFELNLASIIDCFTVLITFMLASASFLSIGILDAGVAAAGATAANVAPPPVNVTVELASNHLLTVKLNGKASTTTPIASKGAEWDYEELSRNLASVKQRWPEVNAVTLTADNTIEYRDVVQAMDVMRKQLPVVLLGGF